jgi:anaerobic ribonucleoside-triphosphate reductase activating protein
VKETTWIIDKATGALTVEGLSDRELQEVASDLLPAPSHVNCARPVNAPPALRSRSTQEKDGPTLRVFRVYHNSVVEGPGRRSVVQLAGCNLFCPGCHTPETHPTDGGVLMSIGEIVEMLLDPVGTPRDGVTVLGGEPFLQHENLPLLLGELKALGQHITLYSGYTLEELQARRESSVHESLALADILIDGRFIASQARGAGEWRGSRNQRIIYLCDLRASRAA